jgi:hypothetical protein
VINEISPLRPLLGTETSMKRGDNVRTLETSKPSDEKSAKSMSALMASLLHENWGKWPILCGTLRLS